eukprot:8424507-Heterocapsa_arctica.AAC.1
MPPLQPWPSLTSATSPSRARLREGRATYGGKPWGCAAPVPRDLPGPPAVLLDQLLRPAGSGAQLPFDRVTRPAGVQLRVGA